MIAITLPDGSVRQFENPLTVLDIAKDISEGLARNVLSAQFNQQTVGLRPSSKKMETYASLPGTTTKGNSLLALSAYILAQSILALYPEAKLTIGPAIENGFYYDVDFGEESFSEKT